MISRRKNESDVLMFCGAIMTLEQSNPFHRIIIVVMVTLVLLLNISDFVGLLWINLANDFQPRIHSYPRTGVLLFCYHIRAQHVLSALTSHGP